MNCGESYVSFLVFLVWTMDPLCGTPCGSAAAQPHVEVTEIKSNSQFPKPWITVNPSVPILSQNANILAQYEQSAKARNGRCYYVPRPFFWSDGTVGPCNDDVGSSILHDFAALIDPSCHSFFFFHNVCPTVGVPFSLLCRSRRPEQLVKNLKIQQSVLEAFHSSPVRSCQNLWNVLTAWHGLKSNQL